jgi:hypothetical protein
MGDIWLPNVERVPGNSAGDMVGDGSRKLLLHSTEGYSISGAVAAYTKNNSWPTLTVDCPRRLVVEHLPLDTAARALRNEAGGVQTNREGTILVQVEMMGFAADPTTIGSPDDLDWFGREVVRPIHELVGVPLACSVPFVAYPASYGTGAAQRLSAGAWDAYSGLLGHQHAPENSHGDPGAIDIGRILAAAGRQEDDMISDAQMTELKHHISDVVTNNVNRVLAHLVPGGLDPDANLDVWSLIKAVDGHGGRLERNEAGDLDWQFVDWSRETVQAVRELLTRTAPPPEPPVA